MGSSGVVKMKFFFLISMILLLLLLLFGCKSQPSETSEPASLSGITGNAVLDVKTTEEKQEERSKIDFSSLPESNTMVFMPMQCEEDPWDEWYKTGEVKFTEKPENQDLILTYYSVVFHIDLGDVAEKSNKPDCTECNVCPKGYYISARAHKADVPSLLVLGWELK